MNSIEKLWDALLSRDSALIQKTYMHLNEKDQKAIMDHLIKMTTETGWHSEQKCSVQAAIDAINGLGKKN
ncbi:MAG: hypothetical protein Q8N39_11480 [Pelolinea sp.]|nr:hypothetical protein [Pelolinea sp.]